MRDAETNTRWREAFTETAKAWWTEERTREITGGKDILILPGEAPMLLRAIGLLHRDAKMPPAQVRKWRQINHMVATLTASLKELIAAHDEVHIVDAGCGRSYLTVLLAWVFEHVYRHPVRILGVDYKAAIISECRRRASLTELDASLRYEVGDLDAVDLNALWEAAHGVPLDLNALVALHACDTATDDAIALGVRHGATLIAVAPCCQAELAAAWKELGESGVQGAFRPFWTGPHLRRTEAATMTDCMRQLLLESVGYDVAALEFVPFAHTPKNTLLRAMLRGDADSSAREAYESLVGATGGVGIKLGSTLG